MADGFSICLDDAERAANEYLAPVADFLLQRGKTFAASEFSGGEAGAGLAEKYRTYLEYVGERQAEGCRRIQLTAQALLEIVDLYRRADAQS